MPMSLNLRVFGPFVATLAGQSLNTRTPRDLQFLAYLVWRHDSPLPREQMANVFWSEGRQGRPLGETDRMTRFARTLHAVGSSLSSERWRLQKPNAQTLLFDTEALSFDLRQFDDALAVGDLAAMETAVRIYATGTPFADWQEPWVEQAREDIRKRLFAALLQVARTAKEQNDLSAAHWCLQQALQIEPLSENAIRLHWETLAAARRYQALRQSHRDFVSLLVNRKQNTSLETTALFLRLRAEAEQFESSAANGLLPSPITPFVSREAEIQEIQRLIRTERLTVLAGTGGIGKSRLAIEVGRRIAEDFYDRAWFIDLSTQTDSDGILRQVATVLHIREESVCPLRETLLAFLRPKKLLLILDNCEHLIDACAHFVDEILRNCAHVKILATSREPLDITGEALWRVPGLDYPDPECPLSPDQMQGYSAVQLFCARASRPQSAFHVDQRNAIAVAQICHLLDGIPLAIELAAAHIHRQEWQAREIAEALHHSLDLLVLGSRTAPQRHQTLRATIDWSYRHLKPQEQQLFQRLSVFAGTWTSESACAICGEHDQKSVSFPADLQSLIDRSFVQIAPGNEEERYRLLETLRQYGQEQYTSATSWADAVSSPEPVRQRHAHYFLKFAERAEPGLRGEQQALWLQRLDADLANLQAALRWASKTGETEFGLRLAGALWRFWYVRGHHEEGLYWLHCFLVDSDRCPVNLRIKALNGAGNIAMLRADYVQARDLLEKSLELKRIVGDPQGIATGLASLANVVSGEEDHQQARALYTESLEIFRKLEDKRNIALTLTNLGTTAFGERDFSLARRLHEESLTLFRALHDDQNTAMALNNLVETLLNLNEVTVARPLLKEATSLCLTLQSRHRFAFCLENYIRLAVIQAQMERAAILFGAEQAFRERMGLPLSPRSVAAYEQDYQRVHNALGVQSFCMAQEQGRTMTQEKLEAFLKEEEEA